MSSMQADACNHFTYFMVMTNEAEDAEKNPQVAVLALVDKLATITLFHSFISFKPVNEGGGEQNIGGVTKF